MTAFVESDDRIDGTVVFPMSRFSIGAMRIFAQAFLAFIAKCVNQPHVALHEVEVGASSGL
jgi:hypothetical protein